MKEEARGGMEVTPRTVDLPPQTFAEVLEACAEIWAERPRCYVSREGAGSRPGSPPETVRFWRFWWGRQQIALIGLVEVVDPRSGVVKFRELAWAPSGGGRKALQPGALGEVVAYLDAWQQRRFSVAGGKA